MRNSPDGEYHHIGHVMDHFSKFHILFPLKTKTADEVANLFKERVLAMLEHHISFRVIMGSNFAIRFSEI